MVARGQHVDFACGEIGPANLVGSLDRSDEIDGVAVRRPFQIGGVVIEPVRHVCFVAGRKVHHEKTVFVRLVPGTFRVFPSAKV